MARQVNTLTPGMSMPTINRMYAQPLDVSGFFSSLQDAQSYAASAPNAYVGQLLTVVTGQGPSIYVITDTAGTLIRIPDNNEVQRIASDLASFGYQGTLSDMLRSDNIQRSQIYIVDTAGLSSLKDLVNREDLPDVNKLEVGDWLIVKRPFAPEDLATAGSFQASLGSWEMNLSGVITSTTLPGYELRVETLTSEQLESALGQNGLRLRSGCSGTGLSVSVNGIILESNKSEIRNDTLFIKNLSSDDIASGDTVQISYFCNTQNYYSN